VHKLLIVAGGHTRLFHGGYEEYVQALGGAPLWSEIAAFEAEHRERQGKLVRAVRATSAVDKTNTAGGSGGAATEPVKPSKNLLARLRKDLETLEDEIVSLEVDLEELEQTLAMAHTLRPEEIETASRKHGEIKKLLQERYADWDARSEDLERRKGGR